MIDALEYASDYEKGLGRLNETDKGVVKRLGEWLPVVSTMWMAGKKQKHVYDAEILRVLVLPTHRELRFVRSFWQHQSNRYLDGLHEPLHVPVTRKLDSEALLGSFGRLNCQMRSMLEFYKEASEISGPVRTWSLSERLWWHVSISFCASTFV